MPIQEVTDKELRTLIFNHSRVIVKFTKTDCPVCERMGKTYLNLSEQARFHDILFLRMDASENPVSSQEVQLTGTPFFAIYKDGVLSTCKLISEEAELKNLLKELA